MDHLDELGLYAFDAHEAFSLLPEAERAAARVIFMVGWNAAMNRSAAALRCPEAVRVALAYAESCGTTSQ